MSTLITWPPFDLLPVQPQYVWIAETLTSPWQLVPDLHATRVTWSVAGNGSAELVWRYGRGLLPTSPAFQKIARAFSVPRWYVKIGLVHDEVPDHSEFDLFWYGTLEVESDRIAGTWFEDGEGVPSGVQHFHGYDLGGLLRLHTVTTSVWRKTASTEQFRIDEGLSFNAGGKPNRSPTAGIGGTQLFAEASDGAQYWNTLECVKYLLREQAPRDSIGDVRVKFRLDATAAAVLPTWDRPVLETHGRTTHELLEQLMPRQRLLSWYTDVGELEDGSFDIAIVPFSFNDEDLAIAAGQVLPANSRQKVLSCEEAHDFHASVKRSSIDAVDQVEVVGAKRRNCCTLSYTDTNWQDGWTSSLETEYDAGASTAGDYPASAEIEDRQRRNADARKAEKLRTVYSRYQIPKTWDGKVKDGLGGGSAVPAIPKDDQPTQVYPFHPASLRLLSTLPLLEGHDYSGTKISTKTITAVADPPFAELTPLVLVPLPEASGKYALIEKIGAAGDLEDTAHAGTNRHWSASVHVVPDSCALEVRVTGGQPQHVIAKTHFTALSGLDLELGDYNFAEFLWTVCLSDHRSCRAVYPSQPSQSVEAVRVLRIEAGDGYRLDYVAPNTVVALDPTAHTLVRSTSGGFARDDRESLAVAARLAWEWHRRPRQALVLAGGRLTRDLSIGDLVLSVGDPDLPVAGNVHVSDVRSCVTEMSVEMPIVAGGGPPPPRTVTWTTAFAELDAISFAPAGRTV